MENNKRDWKSTLHMPNTKFEMKAGLVEKEPIFRKRWEDNEIYRKALAKNKDNEAFILHDGPPYANGSLHVGHALNKILKDIVVRYKTMNGFYSPFTPGWDTHGLPIENKMLSELKMSKDDLDKVTLRKKAKEYALSQVEIQASQFQSMQLFSDFKEKYVTLDPKFEAAQLELFKKMVMEDLVYKGLKPVYWSPTSQSALAEAEIEYEEHTSPQVIVAFHLASSNAHVDKDTSLLIMTTTPWTLIANSGVAVGVNFDYDIVRVNDKKYVIASMLTQSVATLCKWESFEVIKTVKGSDLVGLTYVRPIKQDLTAPVVKGHHVTTDAGTGLVHMAPLFGEDDYIIGKENNLDMIMHVDDYGKFDKQAGEWEGLFYSDANKNIGMYLQEKGDLLSIKFIKHQYPHDWRTHKPVIFRGTPQWFVNVKSKREALLNALKEIKTYPDWGNKRLANMFESRDEWTISRQRTWGVPITIFYDKDGNILKDEVLFDNVISLVREHGTDIWFEWDTDKLLPEAYRGKGITREMDIMDVWFDSGSSSVGVEVEGHKAPFDMYLEGSDQYRGWFNSSLINSVIWRDKAPFKELLTHGFVLDGKKEKMSKSKGNVVDPLKIISTNGADVLRLWVANSEYTSDVSISDDIMKQNIEVYRKIRNTIKFMLGNLFDFNPEKDMVKDLKGFHALYEEKFNMYLAEVKGAYGLYDFQTIVQQTNKLMVELSATYYDVYRDALYVEKADHIDRRSVQSLTFRVLDAVIKIMAPILPTTMEEAYDIFKEELKLKGREESIFLEDMGVEKLPYGSVEELENTWKPFFNVKDDVNKVIDQMKKDKLLSKSSEAIVTLPYAWNLPWLSLDEWKTLLMVAEVRIHEYKEGQDNEPGLLKVEKMENAVKCERCWNHFKEGSLNDENICKRCKEVVSN